MTEPLRIVVPLDGSSLAESALAPALELGGATDTLVRLVHVVERNPPATIHGDRHLGTAAAARDYLAEIVARASARGVSCDMEVRDASRSGVAAEIAVAAATRATDLIILCSHGAGGVRDVILGNIAQQTLGRVKRPVLVVHPPPAPAQLGGRPWLLPVEPVSHGVTAVPFVERIARALRPSHIRLVTVIRTRKALPPEQLAVAQMSPATFASVLELAAADAQAYLAELAERLAGTAAGISCDVRKGDPVHGILAAAGESDAGLVVLATHGRKGLRGLLSGSMATRLVPRARIPILLVPVGG